MNILIVGAGLSGCTIGRILHDKGHNISMIEKENRIGGLCITNIDKNGLKYEPYGARTFHTKNDDVIKFVKRFTEFNGYTHRKGMILNGELFPFPMTKIAVKRLPEAEQIFEELEKRPEKPDMTNFETACISIFGKILYGYFIKNYTEKMWGRKATELSAEWAPKRLELREDSKDGLFAGQWQGLPKEGYSVWLEKMIEGIPVTLNCETYNPKDYDLVISTVPIDEAMAFSFNELEYRSFEYKYESDAVWEEETYGTINLPQEDEWIRKCNFKILHKSNSKHNIVQWHKPVAAGGDNKPMYPISTKENKEKFYKYLEKICNTKNIMPAGRLGLYKYLDMDKAVMAGFDIADLAETYLDMEFFERYNQIKKIISKY